MESLLFIAILKTSFLCSFFFSVVLGKIYLSFWIKDSSLLIRLANKSLFKGDLCLPPSVQWPNRIVYIIEITSQSLLKSQFKIGGLQNTNHKHTLLYIRSSR